MVCVGGACLQNKRFIRVRPAASRLRQQFWPKASLRRKSLLHLHSVFGRSLVYGCDCDLVPELAKGSRQHAGALLLSLRIRFGALLDKSNPLMQAIRRIDQAMAASLNGVCFTLPAGGLGGHRCEIAERTLRLPAFDVLYQN